MSKSLLECVIRQYEKYVNIFKKKKSSFVKNKNANISNHENSIMEKIGLNVLIKNDKKNKGTITFSYNDLDQLNKIINIIKSHY